MCVCVCVCVCMYMYVCICMYWTSVIELIVVNLLILMSFNHSNSDT